jgi:CDP-glycerol glycerophosphotransferase
MKINKRNPLHWLYLTLFGVNVVLAILLRPFRRHEGAAVVVLYGHKLNGNLLAIHNRLLAKEAGVIEPVFLTMDPTYHRRLREAGTKSVLATTPACVGLLVKADAVISDHGLHVLSLMLGRKKLKFFDVWHSIPFKGFDADDFRVQHRFDEVWISSPDLKRLYRDRYGFSEDRLVVTGYARTDCLIQPTRSRESVLAGLGLERYLHRKLVLFAPTWRQDSKGRAIYPFALGRKGFLARLAETCASAGATLLVRVHLNTPVGVPGLSRNVVDLPASRFPDTEQVLLVSDILITDWSSIAFDYLLLNRPTLFLDVEAPFAKGFSLGPEHRFGEVVTDVSALQHTLDRYLRHPEDYNTTFDDRAARIRESIYDDYADGAAAARCVERLRQQVSSA